MSSKLVTRPRACINADLALCIIQRIGKFFETSGVKVQGMSLRTTDKRSMKSEMLRDRRIHVRKATRPVNSSDNTSFMGDLLAERLDIIAVQSNTSKVRSNLDQLLKTCRSVWQPAKLQDTIRKTDPDALVHAQPLGNFAMKTWARGPGIVQSEKASYSIIIYGASAAPRQDLLKANNMRRRRSHSDKGEPQQGRYPVQSRRTKQLKYARTDTHEAGDIALTRCRLPTQAEDSQDFFCGGESQMYPYGGAQCNTKCQ